VKRPPPAPWHPFPLVELCVLVGLVLLVVGFLDADSSRGRALLVAGMLLGSLAGLETALREHLGGVRSHAGVLAGLPAVAVAGALFFGGAGREVALAGAVVAFAPAFLALRRVHRRRV
jgi:hypothetical protein